MKILLIFLLFPNFSSISGQDFSTPEEALKILIVAIETEDLELYKSCWDPEMVEREGMYSRILKDPGIWKELQGGFKGPQEVDSEDFINQEDGTFYKAHITAPEAEGGGVGSLTMKEIDGLWKMHRW